MNQRDYLKLHNILKSFKSDEIECCKKGKQKVFNAHAVSNSKITFKVIQNRKGHRPDRKNLSYVLMSKGEWMVRVDLHGQNHKGVPTPHIHIYDELHDNGQIAISLKSLAHYNETDDVIQSFVEFLKYNCFKHGINISNALDI
ncbi:DUF6978 family protein [Apilactobacillus timberlakei]|uniref:DUF6978 family protein n=1 Tax=Apilactobacillus timberlakei TaxID=2008380 RepID=UPI00112CFEF0|nr:polymorphic toxin type 24 domain-containing protein [Apilactobacillus timberlakei]TPR16689.1 hypothetical protein DYZ95_07555 [Apilactobacillus timberlakei]